MNRRFFRTIISVENESYTIGLNFIKKQVRNVTTTVKVGRGYVYMDIN